MPKKLTRLASRFPALPAAAAAALLGVSLVPAAAHADASCQALVTTKISQVQASGTGVFYDLTRVSAGLNANVGYQHGELLLDGNPYLEDVRQGSNWLQSDRVGNGRPFDVNRGDAINVYVTPDGNLWIWSGPNNEWIVAGANLACSGNTMTGAVNGNVYTLAFRTIQPL
jgi:hypothetical protein